MASPDHDKLHIVPRLLFFEFLLLVRKERSSHDQHRMLHIGKRIKEVFDAQPKSHNIEWFAAQLNCKRANIYNIFNRPTLDTQLLFQISEVLEHDFFHDLTEELSKHSGRPIDEKKKFYDEVIYSVGRLLNRQLQRVAIQGNGDGFAINKWDTDESLMPPSKYIVSVKPGESDDIVPHVHVYSIEERFELRFTINDGPFRMLPIRNYGTRAISDKFEDIYELARNYLFNRSSAAVLYAYENYKFAIEIYNTINNRPNTRNSMDNA